MCSLFIPGIGKSQGSIYCYIFPTWDVFYLCNILFKDKSLYWYYIYIKLLQVMFLWSVYIFSLWPNNILQTSFRFSMMISSLFPVIVYLVWVLVILLLCATIVLTSSNTLCSASVHLNFSLLDFRLVKGWDICDHISHMPR